MKAFFKKYALEINVLLAVLFIVSAGIFWFQYLEEQNGRVLLRAIMFSIFALIRISTVVDLWRKRKENLISDYEVIENEKHLE